MNIEIFDTHAHYDDEAFDEDREEILQKLPSFGIRNVVNVGSNIESCKKTIEIAKEYEYVYCALGVHPSEVAELTEESFRWLREQIGLWKEKGKCVAIGEIGLDYYWPEPDSIIQKEWFIRQLALAREVSLPVVIHSRDAAQDTLHLMREEHAEDIGGVIHCYSYSKEIAKQFLDMGFYFGIGGVLTFKNARKLKEVVLGLPMDRIVLETDCPYLAPEPNRGKRNSSLNLTYVIAQMAELKGISEEKIREKCWENARTLYRLDER